MARLLAYIRARFCVQALGVCRDVAAFLDAIVVRGMIIGLSEMWLLNLLSP